jgi:hypothetical protein
MTEWRIIAGAPYDPELYRIEGDEADLSIESKDGVRSVTVWKNTNTEAGDTKVFEASVGPDGLLVLQRLDDE